MKFLIRMCGLFILAAFFSCNNNEQHNDVADTPIKGTIHISVDESFKPVIEQQIQAYEASYPGTKIIAEYKPESACIKDLYKDSLNRMVIITRGLTSREEKFFQDSLHYNPAWNEVATDAIAVLVNAKSTDTIFSMQRLRQQLFGKINRNQNIVFDGLSATSTVRFVIDSVLNGKLFDTSVVKAAASSREVINYVANNQNAIGMVGIEWIGNPEDTSQVNLLKKVKIAYVQCDICKDSPYVKPMQVSILTKRYPLVRGLYYILKENYTGLGSGFVSFLKYERGQLIFKRAYLGPTMDFQLRNVRLNVQLPKN
ncbi:MAG: substrate-binding domain-containing protein [Bacteroidetes bacterium]|nr:substrate-binding domain-containing protein [Bacteroidota bacterium]MBS1756709.1 substrate-binding domain-containing protein [Bacteroidota bacterium]